jgi:hypothetical protein
LAHDAAVLCSDATLQTSGVLVGHSVKPRRFALSA